MGALTLPVLLLLAGAALLFVEMFMPGFGVFGTLGVGLVVVSAVVTVVTVPYGIFIVIVEIVILAAVVYMIFKYIKKKQLYGKLILDETLAVENKEIGDLNYFLDKEGVSKTSLRPFGSVDFNGVVIDACTDGGYIAENKRVIVISVDGRKIIVKEIDRRN